MKKSELKKMIKPLIRECLTEIFMEMNLEAIVESVVRNARSAEVNYEPSMKRKVKPSVVTEQRQPTKKDQKAAIMAKLNIDEDEWRSVYEGVTTTVEREQEANKPEYATEEQLAELGLFKDYSKFV